MINHCRTLLLNRDSTQASISNFGHEYVPPTFRAVHLPTSLQRVSRALFGVVPDVAGMNYRLRQLAALWHTREIEPYVLRTDARITYDPYDVRLFVESHRPRVEQLRGITNVSFVIEPDALLSDSGRLQYNWLCFGSDPETYDPDEPQPPERLQLPPSWSGSLSDPILLPGSGGVSIRLHDGSLAAENRFNVSLIKRPAVPLAELPNRVRQILTEEVQQALFGTEPDFAIFREWWNDSPQLHFQLSGISLALAYRIDILRKTGGG